MADKQNLTSEYGDDAKKFQELYFIGNQRTTSGAGTFTSLTSSIVYNYTNGEEDLFNQIGVILAINLGTAEDINKAGDLSLLSTTEKANLVGAVNELVGSISTLQTDLGNNRTLTTELKVEVREDDPVSPEVGRIWLIEE